MDEPVRYDVRDTKLWYVTLARGLVALLFAVLVMADPWMPVSRLARFFVSYVVIEGALTVYLGLHVRRTRAVARGWAFLVEAIANAGVAIAALAWPTVTPLRIIGGLRGVVIGGADLLWSHRTKANNLLIELGGIAAFGFGAVLLWWPGPATVALPWLLGLPALVSGSLLVAGALSQFRRASEPAFDDATSLP